MKLGTIWPDWRIEGRQRKDIGEGAAPVSRATRGTGDAKTVNRLPRTVARVKWSQPENR